MGVEVAVEKGAGDGASIPDQAFQAAGAVIAATAAAALKGADLVLKVQRPMIAGEKGGPKGAPKGTDELKNFTEGQEIGRADVGAPVTNERIDCGPLLETKKAK